MQYEHVPNRLIKLDVELCHYKCNLDIPYPMQL